jgi:hypothetical protein
MPHTLPYPRVFAEEGRRLGRFAEIPTTIANGSGYGFHVKT